MGRGLVVAKYNEDISWLSMVPAAMKIYIYDKSGGPKPELGREFYYERLENEGRDAHTFSYHMAKFYDRLDDYTVFAQGWPFDHVGRKKFARMLTTCESDYSFVGHTIFSVVGNGMPECGNLPLTALARELLGIEVFTFSFVWGMQIVLSRSRIRTHPQSLYVTLCSKSIELYKDPTTLPIMERVWGAVWVSRPKTI